MEKIKDIYIIGASGFGREVADTIRAINDVTHTYNIVGFIDDDENKHGKVINDIPVKGGISYLKKLKDKGDKPYAVIAIAEPKIKELIADKLEGFVKWENIIHPTAIISKYAKIGVGNVFQIHVVIGPNIKIGNHCIVNTFSSIGHDAKLGNAVSIMSHCDLMGHTVFNNGVYIGSAVSVTPNTVIGKNAFLGAGSIISKNVEENSFMLGNPARRIK